MVRVVRYFQGYFVRQQDSISSIQNVRVGAQAASRFVLLGWWLTFGVESGEILEVLTEGYAEVPTSRVGSRIAPLKLIGPEETQPSGWGTASIYLTH